MLLFFFFFSSRRRHTRLQGDWSSDVCSSDLLAVTLALGAEGFFRRAIWSSFAAGSAALALARVVGGGTAWQALQDRKSVVEGKRGDLGGRRIIKKKKIRCRVEGVDM